MAYLWLAARVLLAVVFLAAAASKLRDRVSFAEFAASVRPLGVPRGGAILTVLAEAVLPVLLLADATALLGLVGAVALLTVLTAVPAVAVRRGVELTCRCFGPARRPMTARHVLRNGVLLAVAGSGLAATAAAGPVPLAGVLVAAGAGLVGALLMIAFDDLAELVVPRPPVGPPPAQSVRS